MGAGEVFAVTGEDVDRFLLQRAANVFERLLGDFGDGFFGNDSNNGVLVDKFEAFASLFVD